MSNNQLFHNKSTKPSKEAQHPEHIIVKENNTVAGSGVFTRKPLSSGQVIFNLTGNIIAKPTQTSVQIGDKQHIEDVIAQYLNHNCEPNAEVDREKRAIIAIRNIKSDEEITFDYRKNEDRMATPFICRCCGKFICGKPAGAINTTPSKTR